MNSKKVKWGVIGAGGIADRRTIPGIMFAGNAELTAVMDVDTELAERIRAKYGVKKAYDKVESLLADANVEAVYIASPVVCHKEQAIMAANAKKHVLLEKPLALTAAEADEIVGLYKARGLLLASGFMMRFHACHRKMKQIVSEGKLGKVVSCRAQLTCWFPDMPGNWRQRLATSGGGALMDMGVHCIDLVQYITGSKAVKVAGFSGTNTFNYEVEDSSSSLLELENGAYAYVDANFNIPDAAAKCRLEIYGTRGSMLAEGTIGQVEGGKLDIVLSDDGLDYDAKQERVDVRPIEVDLEFGNMYAKEIESFGRSVLSGAPLEVPGEDAAQVQRVIEAIYRSNRENRTIYM